MSFLLLATTLLACGGEYAVETFATDHAEVTCTLLEDCMALEAWGFESTGTCQVGLESAATCGEAYDGDAALSCVEAVAGMSCDDLYAGSAPASCETACPGLWAGEPADGAPADGDTGG